MMSKGELLHLIVSFIDRGQTYRRDNNLVLSNSICHPKEREKIRSIAGKVAFLFSDFNYPESVEFQTAFQGNPISALAMQTRLKEDPVKKTLLRNRFGMALRDLLKTTDAEDLVRPESLPVLSELKTELTQLSNPD